MLWYFQDPQSQIISLVLSSQYKLYCFQYFSYLTANPSGTITTLTSITHINSKTSKKYIKIPSNFILAFIEAESCSSTIILDKGLQLVDHNSDIIPTPSPSRYAKTLKTSLQQIIFITKLQLNLSVTVGNWPTQNCPHWSYWHIIN